MHGLRVALPWLAVVLVACGSDAAPEGTADPGDSGPGPGPGFDGAPVDAADVAADARSPGDTGSPPADGKPPKDGAPPVDDAPLPPGSGARALAIKLRGKPSFMIGMGNDLDADHAKDGAYTLGVPIDLHYAYLVGLLGAGGWPDWNAGGSFVNILADAAVAHGTTPMYTLYSMAAWGDGNVSTVTNDAYMKPYWDGAKLLFQRVALIGKPAVVHLEPDWWGYAQQHCGGDPTKMPVHVTSLAPDCAGLPDDIAGMGRCLVKLARTYAPNAAIGFGVSQWADPSVDKIVAFHLLLGAGDADYAAMETLDRDAGCFEAGTDPNCKRGGSFYWDETNVKSPNFHEHLAFAKAIHDGVGKPLLWWQTPFGAPSDTPGGSAGHYRDNRVHYMFTHVDEFIAAGGAGIAFGTGAGNQTYVTSDGGEFQAAVTKYYASPVPIP